MGSGRRTAGALLVALTLVSCSSGSHASGAPSSASSSSASSSSPAATTSAAPANPDALPAAQEAQVTAALAALDRRAQVAQLFVVGVPLSGLSAADALVAGGVGGVFLHGRTTASPDDLAAVTGRWASAAPGGLRPWVAADQEGGQVQTLQGAGFGDLPSALDQGRLPPTQLATLADGMGASLDQAGVTLDLAPVADIVPAGTAASNAPIGAFDRQYGSTAPEVVSAAGAVVRGLGAHDVTAALKHFPGLGSVRGNTDTTAHVVDGTTPRDGDQVAAFGVLSRNAARPFVMVSSATYELIDTNAPAVFSPVVITDVLRGDIGFRGVVITDDVGTAVAVADVAPGDRAVRFLAAGGTLVLTVDASLLAQMEDAVLARDASDAAFAQKVDAAVRTALVAKARAGLLPPA